MRLRWLTGRPSSSGGRHRAGTPVPAAPARPTPVRPVPVAAPPVAFRAVAPRASPPGSSAGDAGAGEFAVPLPRVAEPAVRLTFADGSEVAFEAHSAGGRPFLTLAEVLLHRS